MAVRDMHLFVLFPFLFAVYSRLPREMTGERKNASGECHKKKKNHNIKLFSVQIKSHAKSIDIAI